MTSTDLNGADEGSLISLEHWYPPGKNCSHLLKGTANQVNFSDGDRFFLVLDQVVRLHFEKMKISPLERIIEEEDLYKEEDLCSETLVLYDSHYAGDLKRYQASLNTAFFRA